MRFGLAFVLVTAVGCGNDMSGGGDDGGGDDTPTPDGGGTIEPPARGFQLVSPEIDITRGQEITYCWYFRTPNTEPMAIKRWVSKMSAGSHHMIMYTTGTTDVKPPGTVSATGCGAGVSITSQPSWTYASQNVDGDLALPTDDGTGKPLAQEIAPNQAGYIQMHYLNSTDNTIKVRVTLNAEAHEPNVVYTKTAAYVTYNASIEIPKDALGDVESMTCNTPPNTKFWLMSTHAHKQAVKTEVKDADAMVFMSTDWEHPGIKRYDSPFYTFASNRLTYTCTYNNTGDNHADIIKSGDSAADDEMCMASGYYFPATKPRFCVNEYLIP